MKSQVVVAITFVFLIIAVIVTVNMFAEEKIDTSNNNESEITSIHMGMNMFMPKQVTIEPDTTVLWWTHDREIHNVVGIFKTYSGEEIAIFSGDIPPKADWSYTFEESGVFEYTCGYHETQGMKGKLVVN